MATRLLSTSGNSPMEETDLPRRVGMGCHDRVASRNRGWGHHVNERETGSEAAGAWGTIVHAQAPRKQEEGR